ncbi:MAG: hypothetical protein R3D33_14750 [Hyphomicrobiaceae bacterium]
MLEDYTRAVDSTMAEHTEALESSIAMRTRSLSERLKSFEQSFVETAGHVDRSVSENARLLDEAFTDKARPGQALADQLSNHRPPDRPYGRPRPGADRAHDGDRPGLLGASAAA